MIILGRECGLAIEMQQVSVQSLVPPQLADAQSAEDFMARLPQVCATPLLHQLSCNVSQTIQHISMRYIM